LFNTLKTIRRKTMDAMTLAPSAPASTDAPLAVPAADTLWINLDQIDIPPDARPHTQEEIEAMSRELQSPDGQLQNIVVVRSGDRYEVRAGVCRVLAARFLKWDKIRCLVKTGVSEFDKLRITFAENDARQNPNPLYQAQLLYGMIQSGEVKNQDELADKLGKKRGTIAPYISLLNMDAKVQEIVGRTTILGIGQVLQIGRLKDAKEQVKMAEKAIKQDLSFRQLKALVDRELGNAPKNESHSVPPPADPDHPGAPEFSFKTENNRRVKFWGSFDAAQDLDALPSLFKQAFMTWAGMPAVPPSSPSVPDEEAASTHIRLPQTPAEEAELEAAAHQGPHAAYEWILGKDSPYVAQVKDKTWQEVTSESDPKAALNMVMQGFKTMAAST
jgi:ParB/RepB/Spo0J family partition protein